MNYAGTDLGIVEEFSVAGAPNERQVNAYPGVHGLESLDLGSRGGKSSVRGAFAQASALQLTQYQNIFRQYQYAGASATFNDGTYLWTNVILESFRTVGPRYVDRWTGFVYQRYEIELLHLDLNL